MHKILYEYKVLLEINNTTLRQNYICKNFMNNSWYKKQLENNR